MKDVFLVHITLPDFFSQQFYELIPRQRDTINKLLEKRTVLSYSLDMERNNVWVFMEAKSENEVMDILSTFPIIKHVKVTIHELAFHDAAPMTLPDLFMN
jgi:hypothetical protein